MALTTLFIYVVFLCLFVGALWRPILGILGYLAIYLLYNPNIWWGAGIAQQLTRPSFFAMILLAITCFLHRQRLEWKISRREVEIYLFLGIAWLTSLVFGLDMHEGSWMYLEKLTKTFIFLFLFIRVVHSISYFKILVWAFVLGAVFLGYQAHVVGQFSGGRLDNIGGIDFREANQFASFLAFSMTLIGFQMLSMPLWKKAFCAVAIAAMLNAIIMTQSRAVFIGIALATPFILFRTPKQFRKQIYVSIGLGVLLFVVLADVKFLDRMRTIQGNTELMQYDSTQAGKEAISRLDFWKASVRIFADHPLGIGVKNFEKIVAHYDPRNPGMDAHNTYVLCYSELGILGILLFLIVILEALFQLRRVRQMVIDTPHEHEITLFSISLTTVFLIYFLGTMVTHSILYSEMLWILLAMPICLENATRKLLESPGEANQKQAVTAQR